LAHPLRDPTRFVRQSCGAAEGAQPGTHPAGDARTLGGRDLAARNGGQNGAQHRPAILPRAHQRQVDPNPLGGIAVGQGRRQQLHGERPQQMGLAVEQIRQRLRAERPGHKLGHAPLGIADAARPALGVARDSLGEAPARVARARRKRIRTKWLIVHDYSTRKQPGRIRRVGINVRHRRGSGGATLGGG